MVEHHVYFAWRQTAADQKILETTESKDEKRKRSMKRKKKDLLKGDGGKDEVPRLDPSKLDRNMVQEAYQV